MKHQRAIAILIAVVLLAAFNLTLVLMHKGGHSGGSSGNEIADSQSSATPNAAKNKANPSSSAPSDAVTTATPAGSAPTPAPSGAADTVTSATSPPKVFAVTGVPGCADTRHHYQPDATDHTPAGLYTCTAADTSTPDATASTLYDQRPTLTSPTPTPTRHRRQGPHHGRHPSPMRQTIKEKRWVVRRPPLARGGASSDGGSCLPSSVPWSPPRWCPP